MAKSNKSVKITVDFHLYFWRSTPEDPPNILENEKIVQIAKAKGKSPAQVLKLKFDAIHWIEHSIWTLML